ncbi:hypothetical protein CCP3SC5AM1_2230005 [Gammaproteobacteria bacterium]
MLLMVVVVKVITGVPFGLLLTDTVSIGQWVVALSPVLVAVQVPQLPPSSWH